MDDFNPNDGTPFGGGDYGGHDPNYKKIEAFMDGITRGVTSKIPEGIDAYLPKPTVAELESAGVYVVQNASKFSDSNADDLSEQAIRMYTNAITILIRGCILDAVNSGKKILSGKDTDDFCMTVAEQAYTEKLYRQGLIELLFPADPEEEPECVFTTEGKTKYAQLYMSERERQSAFTLTLEKIAGGVDESKSLMKESLHKRSQELMEGGSLGPLGEMLRDIMNSINDMPEDDDDDTPDEDKPEKGPWMA